LLNVDLLLLLKVLLVLLDVELFLLLKILFLLHVHPRLHILLLHRLLLNAGLAVLQLRACLLFIVGILLRRQFDRRCRQALRGAV